MQTRLRALVQSWKYAVRGIAYVYRNEQNFRIQLIIGILVCVLMALLGVSQLQAVALIFVMMAVLIMEVINTIVERLVDVIKPRLHTYAAIIKDMMAGAVMLTALAAAIIGGIIFLPYIAQLI